MADEVIYGWHPLREALGAERRKLKEVYLLKGKPDARELELEELCRAGGIVVRRVERAALDRLAGTPKHQGVAAIAEPLPPTEVEDLLAVARKRREMPFLVALDGIEDPHNLGAIMRTAEGAGVHGLIIPARRSAKPGATVTKTSAGASEYLPLAVVGNMNQTLERLKREGLWVIGLHHEAQTPYHKVDYKCPLVLVVGGEGKGLHQEVRKKCDLLASIPQRGRVSSLNASVAAAILIYEAWKQRGVGV